MSPPRSGGRALVGSCVFASDTTVVRDVMVGGRWVVRERHHAAERHIVGNFRTLDRIGAA